MNYSVRTATVRNSCAFLCCSLATVKDIELANSFSFSFEKH